MLTANLCLSLSDVLGAFYQAISGIKQIFLQADNLNVWVMGPELGEFIAGIRNEDNQQCVTDETRWLYASRASVWKSDDRSLTVKCYEPEGEVKINVG